MFLSWGFVISLLGSSIGDIHWNAKKNTHPSLSLSLMFAGIWVWMVFYSEIGSHIISGNVFDPIAMNELFPDKSTTNPDIDATSQWTQELLDVTGSYATPVVRDEFSILYNASSSLSVPNFLLPPQLHNQNGNYIISLSQLCRYLSHVAENQYGVEIYPGFAASEVLLSHDHQHPLTTTTTSDFNAAAATTPMAAVIGIATLDVGITKDGTTLKSTYTPGVEIHAKQTLFAEGARGSCSEWLMNHFNMRQHNPNEPNHTLGQRFGQPQTYGLGLKEVWQIPPEQFRPGLVQHSIGYPLQSSIWDKNYGGSFLYHQEPDLLLIGYVVGLDYANPYINPYREFQKWKTHPTIAQQLQNGTCISYGARVLNEGGYHSIPQRLTVPGAALIGCSAGFLNAVKIKGTHTAMKSGMIAAEATYKTLVLDGPNTSVATTGTLDASTYEYTELIEYMTALRQSWIYKELYEVRNSHAAFSKWGVLGGLAYTAFTTFVSKGKEPWTLRNTAHHESDSACTRPAAKYEPIQYPPPDNVVTFDLLTNLQRSNTYHEEDQPCHLKIKDTYESIPTTISIPIYDGPEQRFCPAGVYEYVDDTTTTNMATKDNNNVSTTTDPTEVVVVTTTTASTIGTTPPPTLKRLVINGQNCIHCKCCSIKMPKEYIEWTVPEGGGGPQYQVM
jgi:electron-transferring-flavoprotein dehydrogenase